MSNILERIIQHKQQEVLHLIKTHPLSDLQAQPVQTTRGFIQAIQQQVAQKKPAVIAEIKKASPSKGIIREDFDPAVIAESYASQGATCLSVLTDEAFFQGSKHNLLVAHQHCVLPILRKDFIIDAYQVYESRAMGADCILLIVAALSPEQLRDYYHLAGELGLDVLIEVHNAEELQQTLSLQPALIGINNRNLKTFETSLQTSVDLLAYVPESVTVVTESGVHTVEDVRFMQAHDIYGFLVGEALMRQPCPGQALRDLFG